MIRVFIGASPNGEDAEAAAVLEYSLRKHASEPVDLTWMILSRDPASPFYSNGNDGWQTEKWPTPFSCFRWAISALCGFEGKAIYLDVDMVVMDDIAKLWNQELQPGKIAIAKSSGRLCTSLWDCERAQSFMLPTERLNAADGHAVMRSKMQAHPHLVQQFTDGNWNCLDGESYERIDDPRIKILHLTSMPHQPHLPRARARLAGRGASHWFDGTVTPHFRKDVTALFETMLQEAEANGYPVANYDPGETFGAYRKTNLTALIGKRPSWAA